MITRQLIKQEIDSIPDNCTEVLYKIIKALQISNRSDTLEKNHQADWQQFINETYGCLAGDPIERGKQGEYEKAGILKRILKNSKNF